ncbi:MAG: DUF6261 family protein [Prevotellaceae bacterium]|jgi:hypothetical protein|nr:DUF6261 family protein [Prevotellaceae bacterium]
METILRKPDLSHFNISDHLEFHKLSYQLCLKCEPVIGDHDLIVAYGMAVDQEETVYKWLRKSEYTQKKANADHARDKTYMGMTAVVRNSMKDFDPMIRDHAVHVHNLLEVYGNVTKADYDGETADIDSLVVRLRSDAYRGSVMALGLSRWINELYDRNEEFKIYVDDATQEKVDKPAISSRAANRQTDEALRKVTNRDIALIILNGAGPYREFITPFNVLVDHYNTLVHEHYGRLHARIDITPSAIGAIPEQPFTGKPVFVLPELTLMVEREGKQIMLYPVFSEDFTVAYQNNINPGTATLIIKGIGKYAGEITTTFNIIRTV